MRKVGISHFLSVFLGSSTSFGARSTLRQRRGGATRSGIAALTATLIFAPLSAQAPAQAAPATGIAASIAVGGGSANGFACALTTRGQVFCWGANNVGQLGNSTSLNSNVPVAVTTSGVLAGKTVTAIAAGNLHACALTSDSKVFCWGQGTSGQLGNNTRVASYTPVAVDMTGVLSGKTVTAITAGYTHSCAVTSDGKAFCWGIGDNGTLGSGSASTSPVPVAVSTAGVLSGQSVTGIAANQQTCVVASGKTYCWGVGTSGELGNNAALSSNAPVAVNTSGALSGKTTTAVAAGSGSSCTLTSEGKAYCWGVGSSGQLGSGSGGLVGSNVPVAVDTTGVLTGKTLTAISAGSVHACATANDGKAYCWGGNGSGQLGNSSTTAANVPVAVNTSGVLSGKTVSSISAGGVSSCALTSDKFVFCWGANGSGQLGNKSTTDSNVPVAVNFPPDAPTGVTAVPGDTQATVSWTVPAYDGGSAITGYTVTSSPGGKTCTTTSATSCTVTGLTNGIAYTFTVTATNAVGTGPASAASASVVPAKPVPTLTIDSVQPMANSAIINFTAGNLAVSASNEFAFTFTCEGTRAAASECFDTGNAINAPIPNKLWPLSYPSTPTVTTVGGKFTGKFTQTYYAKSATESGSALIGDLMNGVTYTISVSLTANAQTVTASAASSFTVGPGPTNITMTPAGATTVAPGTTAGCWYNCFGYAGYGVPTGSKVKVSWTAPSSTSFSYYAVTDTSTGARQLKTVQATGYLVGVLPSWVVSGKSSMNPINYAIPNLYLDSTSNPADIAKDMRYGNAWGRTQFESDGCSAVESGSYPDSDGYGVNRLYTAAWFVGGSATTSVTLNGCHFARDQKYIAVVMPIYLPQSLIDDFADANRSTPYQWDSSNKLFPFTATLGSRITSSSSEAVPNMAAFFNAGVSAPYAADGTALHPELGPVPSVTAAPASTTDPDKKGTLKVSWTAPENDVYFSKLSYDVYSAASSSIYGFTSGVATWPPAAGTFTRVTSGFKATPPTKYIVKAISQDSNAWFGWLGWNGAAGVKGSPTCEAIAPATTCTLTGLATWTKYIVIVQAVSANAAGWINGIRVDQSKGTASTIWPLAPSEPLEIGASNPTKTSTTIAWKTPKSVGGPAGVVISKYTAAMVPKFVPVEGGQIQSRSCSGTSGCTMTSIYGNAPGGYGMSQLDALPGNNNLVAFTGYNCDTASSNYGSGDGYGETCYVIFDSKGFKYKYKLTTLLGASGVADSGYQVRRVDWMHREKWGYLISFTLGQINPTYPPLAKRVLAYMPFVSTSATFNATTGVVPGGPDFSKIRVVNKSATSADIYGGYGVLTAEVTDAHMFDADTVVGIESTTSTTGSPKSDFYYFSLADGSFTKSASPALSIGCYVYPSAWCRDWTTLSGGYSSNPAYPITQFSLSPTTGNIYFTENSAQWGGGRNNTLVYRSTYNKLSKTYATPESVKVDGSSSFGYWGGINNSNVGPANQWIRFDDDGNMNFSWGGTQQYSESDAGFDVIAGTFIPVVSYDWWWSPGWLGNYWGGVGSVVRTSGGQLFGFTQRWIGDLTQDPQYWGSSYANILNVMLDSKSHICTTTGALSCTVQGTVSGAAYGVSVFGTNKESNGKTKDGPAGAFADVIAGVPNAPDYISSTLGASNGSSAPATITFGPSLVAAGGVDTTVTKYTCTVYNTSGTQVAKVDVTPPSGLTPASRMTCTTPGLTIGKGYIVAITATSAEGTSFPAKAPQLVVATPPAPQAISYDSTTKPGQLTWSTVGTGTDKVTIYSGNPYPGPATPATGVACAPNEGKCTPSGLKPGTTYYAMVCTTNTLTTTANATTGALPVVSPATTPSNCAIQPFTTPEVPKPDAPKLTLSPGDTKLTLTWVPGAANDTTITGYVVTVSPSAGTGCTALAATAKSCVLTGLTNGTVYTVTIKVKYTSEGLDTPANVTDVASMPPFAPPATPAKPTVTAGNGKATVSWTAVTAPANMTINSYTVTAAPGGLTCTVDAPATTCDVSGLTNGTAYTFTVTANYTNNNLTPAITDDTLASPASAAVTPQATAPTAAPTGVTATAANAKATVSWTAVTDDGGSPITSYVVTASPGGKTCTATAPATTCDVTGLTNGTAYTFTVSAKNAKGTGPASSPSSAVTPQATVPAPPTAVKVAIASATSLSVSWTAPTDNGGSAITGYTVSVTDGTTTKSCDVNGTTTKCDVTGLTQGTPYTVSVVAKNYVGESAKADAAAAVAPAAPPSTITAPTATVGSTSATVRWDAPASNGSDITKYTVTASPGGKTCTLSAPFPTPLECTVTGLTIGTKYTFTVTATNGAGTSTASGASNSITGASAPSGLAAPKVTAVANNNSNGQLKVTWIAPTAANGTVSGYTVTASPGGATCTTTGALTCTVTGLTNGTAYTFTVKATNEIGDSVASPASAAATPSTLPNAPTGVTGRAGVASAVVSWTAPVDNGGAAVTKYTVTASPGGASCSTTGALTCTVTGLANGTAYTFTVTATNINGSSGASDASASTSPAALPTAPTISSAQRSGTNAVTVGFSRPADPAGAPVTGYTLTAQPGGKTCVVADPSVLTCAFADLTPGTSYTFTVVATNRIGNSPASKPSAAVVAATNPSAPTDVVANVDPKNKDVDRQAFVSWKAPANTGGLPIKGYLVTAAPGGATCVAIAPATSCIVKGLTNGTAYTFSVVAVNDPAFAANALGNTMFASQPSSASSEFTPTWSNQVKIQLVLTPPTGPTQGSTVSLQYDMRVTVNFSPTAPATSYTIKLNGKSVGTVNGADCTATLCTFSWTPPGKYVLRTSDVVTVTSSNKFTIAINPSTPAALAVAELHYGTGLSTVNPGSDEAKFLDEVAQLVKDNSYLAVTLTGYTDDDGSASTNLTLSTKRATNAANYLKTALAKLGVTKVTLTAVGKGIDKTYASGCGANPVDDCAKNRRVMVQVSGQLAAPSTPAAPSRTTRNSNVVLTWTAPNNNGAPITGYTVYYSTDADYQVNGTPDSSSQADLGNWKVYCTTTTAVTCSAGAGVTLTNGTGYRFVVVATNVKGASQVSNVSALASPSLTVADAPTAAVSAITKTGFTISVTAAAYTGGSDVTGYAWTVLQGTTVVKTGTIAPGTPVAVTGLKSGTAYTVSVTATNGVGTSAAGTKAATTLK